MRSFEDVDKVLIMTNGELELDLESMGRSAVAQLTPLCGMKVENLEPFDRALPLSQVLARPRYVKGQEQNY